LFCTDIKLFSQYINATRSDAIPQTVVLLTGAQLNVNVFCYIFTVKG